MTIPKTALDQEWHPDHFVYRFADLEIKTDRWDRKESDRVLGLGGSVHILMNYMWHHPELVKGKSFFEPFAGSGPLGFLALCLGSAHTTLLDVNPRAIGFMKQNAARNGFGESRYTIAHGDIQTFTPNRPYDMMAANPPFVPVPDGVGFPIHSNGGLDGNSLTCVLLERIDSLLSPDGEALLTTFQIEDKDGPLLARYAEKLVRNRSVELTRRRRKSFPFGEMVSDYQAGAPHRKREIASWSELMTSRYGALLRFNYYVVHIGRMVAQPTECTVRDCDGSKYGMGFSLDSSSNNLIGGEIRAFVEKPMAGSGQVNG